MEEKIIKKEEKFIVSLIRNENLENDYFADIDCQEVLRLLYNQKIFLRFYSKLLNIKKFLNIANKIHSIKKYLLVKKNIYNEVFIELIKLLEENHINYILYKGIILEKLIYDLHNIRQFDDIDIIISNDEEEKFVDLVRNKFKKFKDIRNKTIEICGEKKILVIYKKQVITIELKTKFHLYKPLIKTINQIEILSNNVKTFNLNETFCCLIIYYLEFTRNIEFLRNQKKINLQYAIDLYLYIKKYFIYFDYHEIIFILRYNNVSLKMVSKIFLELSYIFNDKTILLKCKKLLKNKIKDNDDLLDNLAIFDRFFNNLELIKYFEKYYLGYFNFTKRNKVLPHHLVFYNNIITDFKYIKKDSLLYIQIKPRMEENMVIHLNIFGYRKTGEFIDPYIPITLRMINNNIIKSLFYAPTFNSLYDYEKEKEFYYGYIDEIVKIKNGLVETTLIIDLNKFPHYLDINRNIGFNMYLYKLKNNSIFKCFCIQPYYRKPLLIK